MSDLERTAARLHKRPAATTCRSASSRRSTSSPGACSRCSCTTTTHIPFAAEVRDAKAKVRRHRCRVDIPWSDLEANRRPQPRPKELLRTVARVTRSHHPLGLDLQGRCVAESRPIRGAADGSCARERALRTSGGQRNGHRGQAGGRNGRPHKKGVSGRRHRREKRSCTRHQQQVCGDGKWK